MVAHVDRRSARTRTRDGVAARRHLCVHRHRRHRHLNRSRPNQTLTRVEGWEGGGSATSVAQRSVVSVGEGGWRWACKAPKVSSREKTQPMSLTTAAQTCPLAPARAHRVRPFFLPSSLRRGNPLCCQPRLGSQAPCLAPTFGVHGRRTSSTLACTCHLPIGGYPPRPSRRHPPTSALHGTPPTDAPPAPPLHLPPSAPAVDDHLPSTPACNLSPTTPPPFAPPSTAPPPAAPPPIAPSKRSPTATSATTPSPPPPAPC